MKGMRGEGGVMRGKEEVEAHHSIVGHVSKPLRITAAWSWRFLIVLATLGVLGLLLYQVRSLVIAVLVALLLALLLAPLINKLRHWGIGRTLSAVIGLFTGIILVFFLLSMAVGQLLTQLPTLIDQTVAGIASLTEWIGTWPIDVGADAFEGYFQDVEHDMVVLIQNYGGAIASEAWVFASTAISVGAAGLILIFVLFFLLKDGHSMWIWFVRMLPKQWRYSANEAGIRAWVTLGFYIRTQMKVAAMDALGIGLGAFALGVPGVVPIMVLVFFAAFIPILGAFISGAVAVLLALVNNGFSSALIMLLVVLAVQQIEGNVLHPWLMASAVSLHPAAVLLSVTAGGMIAGIPGAIFAVPILAVVNVVFLYLHGHDMYPWLNRDPDRPGGPPGSLEAEIEASYSVARPPKRLAKTLSEDNEDITIDVKVVEA